VLSRFEKRFFMALVVVGLGAGCAFEYPTEWQVPERGTFGEEVFGLIRKELSLSEEKPTEKVAAFDARRDQFVTALDTMVPADTTRPLHELFVSYLPLYDDDTLPAFTRKAGAVLADLGSDRAALEVLAREDQRLGYDPDVESLLARIAKFPDLREMMVRLSRLLLDNYGRDENGAPNGEPEFFGNLLAAAGRFLDDFEADRSPDRTPALLADLLLREDQRLAKPTQLWAVRRDPRSVAQVAVDPSTGTLYAPFVDQSPRDGLADVDGADQPIDRRGQLIDLKPFGTEGNRDAAGRLLAPSGGRTIFEYVDLRKTLLGALLPDMRTFVERDVPFRALRAARSLLGTRRAAIRNGEPYQGFDGAPVLDLAHGLFAALNSPDVPDVLAGLRTILDGSTDTVAGALRELDRIDEVRDRHPGGALTPHHRFEDDLIAVVRQIAEVPGLLQAMLEALADPASRGNKQVFGQLMKYKKARVTIEDVDQGRVFGTLVDRGQPDRGENKSLFQRLLQLMWETDGISYDPTALGILPVGFIFKIDDLAAFYLDVVAGNAEVPTVVTWVTPLSKNPTPQEVNRFLNTEQTLMSEPTDREGQVVRLHNGDTLLALEAAGGPVALKPLCKAFSDRGQTKLLVRLFVTLHLHYASPRSDYQSQSTSLPSYSQKTGIVTYEGMLQELLGETPFLDRVTDLVVVLARTRVGSRLLGEVLQGLVQKLVAPDPTLRTRSGENRVTRDSGNVVSPISPWDLLRVGLKSVDAALDRDADAKDAWEKARKDLVDVLLGTVESAGRVTFKNPRAVVFTSHVVGFLGDRVRRHIDGGTWTVKLTRDYPQDLLDLVTGPGLAAAVEMFDAIDADETLKNLFRSFAVHILPTDGLDGDRLLRLGAKLLHLLKDGRDCAPLAKFLGRALRPESGFVISALRYLEAAMRFDEREILKGILERGAEAPAGGKSPLSDLGDALGAVLRVEPGAPGSWSADDFGRFISKLSEFMLDPSKGLEKLIKIVKGRK
jgi:hypothetical protein